LLLYQPKNSYCYNSDTHFLFNFICKCFEKYKNIKGNILDIGSGSGILGFLLVKKYEKLSLNQCEIQSCFQFFSQQNAKINNVNTKLYKGSFLDLKFDTKFDFCVSNPPFYHQNVIKSENSSLKIARYNSFMPLKEFIEKSSDILKNDGKLFFCYDSKQLNDIILFLKQFRFNLEALQFVYPKVKKDANLVLVYAKKNSKSLLKVLNPLIVFDENLNFTKEVEEIYKNIKVHSIKVNFE